MLPAKLKHGDPFGVMLNLWNSLIDYLHSEHIVAGAGISVNRTPSGTVVSCTGRTSAAPGTASASNEYNGYFKLVDISDGSGIKIRVVDGHLDESHYLAEHVCGLYCYNPKYFSDYHVQAKTFNITPTGSQETYYVYFLTNVSGNFRLVCVPYLILNTNVTQNIRIGKIEISSSGEVEIIQEHQTGIIYQQDFIYTGPGKITSVYDNSEENIPKITMHYDDVICVNNVRFYGVSLVNPVQNITPLNNTSYVWFEVEYDPTRTEPFFNAKFGYGSSRPESTGSKTVVIIARITYNHHAVLVEYYHTGPIQIFYWGTCDHA